MPSAMAHSPALGQTSCFPLWNLVMPAGLMNGTAHSMDTPDTEPRSPGSHRRPVQSVFASSAPNMYPHRGLRVNLKTSQSKACPGFPSSADAARPPPAPCFRQAPFSTTDHLGWSSVPIHTGAQEP